jgi:hypothetical protein
MGTMIHYIFANARTNWLVLKACDGRPLETMPRQEGELIVMAPTEGATFHAFGSVPEITRCRQCDVQWMRDRIGALTSGGSSGG